MTSAFANSFNRLLMAGLASALLAACAGSSDKYPSLAIRDAERVTGQFTPSVPDEEPVPPVASSQQLTEIIAAAAAAQRSFLDSLPDAQRLVEAASGAGIESDIRSRALVALADLTSIRGETVLALAKLDSYEAEAATGFAPVQDIEQAQNEIALLVNEQEAIIDSLGATLR